MAIRWKASLPFGRAENDGSIYTLAIQSNAGTREEYQGALSRSTVAKIRDLIRKDQTKLVTPN